MPVVSLLGTGEAVVGGEIRSFDSVIRELLGLSIKEVQIAAYGFDRSFGPVLEELYRRTSLGGGIMKVITRPPESHDRGVRTILERLRRQGILIYPPPGCNELVHAKVLVVNRQHAIIGSANFTYGGLTANHELGVWLKGSEAWELARALDRIEYHLRGC